MTWEQEVRVYLCETDGPIYVVHRFEWELDGPQCRTSHSRSLAGVVPTEVLRPERVRPCRRCWPE